MSRLFTICYGTPDNVSNEVNILLDDGWELQGNLVTSSGSPVHDPQVYQAMILPPKKKKQVK